MKRVLLTVVASVILYSCNSDTLTHGKAEKIISECFEETPRIRTTNVSKLIQVDALYPQTTVLKQNEAFAKEGLVNIDVTKGNITGSKDYNISITPKGSRYLSSKDDALSRKINLYSIQLDKVLEIHENPSNNTAEVTAIFKRVDITPFQVVLDNLDKESRNDFEERWRTILTKTYSFKKTSNGWVFNDCDEGVTRYSF